MRLNFISFFLYPLLLLLSQILFFQNINFNGLINPHIYLFVVLFLPRDINLSFQFLMIFVYGLIVDYFCLTDGIATFSLLLLVLFRFLILKIIYNKDESEAPILNREIQGYAFIFRYVFIGVFFYHLTFFLVESFKFYDILYNLMRTILTTVFVVLFYSLINFIYLSKQKK